MLEIIPGITAYIVDQKLKKEVESDRFISNKFTRHHNYGFASNLGAGQPKLVKVVSVLLSIWASALFVISFTFAGARMLRCGLALLLGGAYSNTYDRVKKGYVIDYLQLPYGPKFIKRLIWNVGDFAIIIGALICVIGGN